MALAEGYIRKLSISFRETAKPLFFLFPVVNHKTYRSLTWRLLFCHKLATQHAIIGNSQAAWSGGGLFQ